MCRCCNTTTNASPIYFNVRGINRTPFTGRIFIKGTILCDDCAQFFTNAT
jgi:hypothetical protein